VRALLPVRDYARAVCVPMAAAGSSSGEGPEEQMDIGEAQAKLEQMRATCQELSRKINELDMDNNEHKLVVEALTPLDPGRKCFRMVGSVIVERTVSEVLPAVQKNMEQISGTMDKLTETLKAQQKAADEFATKYRLTAKPGTAASAKEPDASEVEPSQGVLI